ncbi:hypothetical protein, variant 4 [Verruconis gallopava]|uniref:GATA-type domain-containing protein n=1 Tax=Verruconis gallopava TaxID=253628 RepID=A0A0D2AAH8_9PEZI|nr:uncharacterized protein PV09_05321 [Verruconis gallopava]XP_016213432.1 hypothetical protein, variant 1 [Verruconis gallopava]XP_016213433.1 hypothetical protein, variant 2 [Verruconis gallopava]XP_016213434.1 hypothetical protein, variant 3 [Verruconis gallopava]XP_016213435.1 hypothetical protein, variant 4 [Verruconis gallopava]KIW03562.1 hypothetical protein PV09_05321 [Verruconis gallopava]KIW03563.1 hypothetical protein, variant 1 [Verruconis gallopava]KIW03564.1 hypothetical protei
MSAAATMASPALPFPGPPPPPSPYSHTTTGSTSNPLGHTGLISPPDSRRTSGDEPSSVPTTRQSLPSISEALGSADHTLPYPPQVPPPAHSSSSSYFPAPASTSVADLHRRSVTSGPVLPEPPHSYPSSHPQSPFMNRGPPPVQPPHTPTAQADAYSRPPYPPQPPKLPTLHPIKTDSSPTASFRPPATYASQHPSPAYDTPPHTAPSQPPYPYSGNQSQGYQYQHPSAPSASGPLYSSGAPPAPPRPYAEPGRWENGQMDDRARSSMSVGFHGDSVKRHLDDFDLEASLNEVAECSGKMLEFTREYGVRTHGNQRAGISPRSVPHLQTVDELMAKSRRIEESLKRIREMVIAQNHAIEQQMKDPSRPVPANYPDMNGYSDDKQGMGGFAGSDTKKRRGRAAPPGRCHSCNRAETPEWRRGPDGARTLCNACGLHYAKLTRKMGNKAQIGSSNLRPKSES